MTWIAFGVLGRLVVWTLQVNGLIAPIFNLHPKLQEMRQCDFCLGFWVFSLLAWAFTRNLLDPIYVPILSESLTGLVASFVAHLARIGWESKFAVVNLGEFNDGDP